MEWTCFGETSSCTAQTTASRTVENRSQTLRMKINFLTYKKEAYSQTQGIGLEGQSSNMKIKPPWRDFLGKNGLKTLNNPYCISKITPSHWPSKI